MKKDKGQGSVRGLVRSMIYLIYRRSPWMGYSQEEKTLQFVYFRNQRNVTLSESLRFLLTVLYCCSHPSTKKSRSEVACLTYDQLLF